MRYKEEKITLSVERYKIYRLAIKKTLEDAGVNEHEVVSIVNLMNRVGRKDLFDFLRATEILAKILPLDESKLIESRVAVKGNVMCDKCKVKFRFGTCPKCHDRKTYL